MPGPTPLASPAPEIGHAASLPTPDDRHLLSRFSFGITPALVEESAAAGGARAWFEQQLAPEKIDDPASAEVDDWYPTVHASYGKKLADARSDRITPYEQNCVLMRWALMQRIRSRRQLQAVMTDFWSNLLFVEPTFKTFQWRADYELVVRAHALSSFVELLTAALLHPAMLVYLDNSRSTKAKPNENLGRELLELHTVGRDAQFTEREVRDSMWILTGYRVEQEGECQPYYAPDDHATRKVRVLGFEHPNEDPDGRAVTTAYLRHLALLPATANRIAARLVQRFVADEPDPTLVAAVADAYLANESDIPATLRALVDHPRFRTTSATKVRTPVEDFVNTYRVLEVNVLPPSDEESAGNAILVACTKMGQRPFSWPRPDGFPETGESWSSAGRMLGSWRIHRSTAGGLFPRRGIEYRPDESWLPPLPATFAQVVDHMCHLILAKQATSDLLEAACASIDVEPDKVVEEDSALVRHKIPVVLLALLDTPHHMSR